MFKVSLNEVAALNMVLEFIDVKDLITMAMHGYAETETERAKDNVDVCFKALETFLK